jgi:hypothetical protein
MRVVLLADTPADGPGGAAWLRPGVEYEVLDVTAYPGGHVDVRLASEQSGVPALFDSSQFTTVDDTIPASWRMRVTDGGVLRIGPEEWLRPGFWEGYFDDDPEARAAFDRGASRP